MNEMAFSCPLPVRTSSGRSLLPPPASPGQSSPSRSSAVHHRAQSIPESYTSARELRSVAATPSPLVNREHAWPPLPSGGFPRSHRESRAPPLPELRDGSAAHSQSHPVQYDSRDS